MPVNYYLNYEQVIDLIQKGKETYQDEPDVIKKISEKEQLFLSHFNGAKNDEQRQISIDGFLSVYSFFLISKSKTTEGRKLNNTQWIMREIYMSSKPHEINHQ